MKYFLIFLILMIIYLIEFLLYSREKKFIIVSLIRYVIINFILTLFYLNIENIYVVILLALFKLFLDKIIVFKKLEFKVTDWREYYSKKPLKIVSKKRENNINYILNILEENNFNGRNFLEYGGGNSSVAEAISKKYKVDKFTIVDNNQYGIDLLDNRDIKNLNKQCLSIFDFKDKEIYDLIYSVGLIEHFQGKDFENCVLEHFKYAKKGGYILYTFPVPVFRYKVIRTIYEIFNKWQYTDEIPLNSKTVENVVKKHNGILRDK